MRKHTARTHRPKTPPCLIAVGMSAKHEGAIYCAIQAFRRGKATADHFLDLCDTRDITAIAHNMQGRHVDGLREALAAAEIALLNIRDRRRDTGRFGVSGDELAALALLVDTYTNYWLAQSGHLYGLAREELRRARLRDTGGEKAA